MKRANPLDRALLHGLHQRLASRPETIGSAALGTVLQVAQAYTQSASDGDASLRDAIEEFDEDSLALVEILMLAVLQSKGAKRLEERAKRLTI